MTQPLHRYGEIAPVCVFKSPLGHADREIPANQASLEHAARPPAGRRAAPAPPCGQASVTAPLIAAPYPAAYPAWCTGVWQAIYGPPPAYGRGAGGPGGLR
jgi:hypothetical protein